MNRSVYFLDASIFMYAAGAAHTYKDPCLRILTDLEAGRLVAAINTEIIQEILYRYSHINLADKGLQLAREILQYPLQVFSVTLADIHLAIDIYEAGRADGLKPRDAIHAATMKRHKVDLILTTDKHFDTVDSIRRLDPLTFASPVTRDSS